MTIIVAAISKFSNPKTRHKPPRVHKHSLVQDVLRTDGISKEGPFGQCLARCPLGEEAHQTSNHRHRRCRHCWYVLTTPFELCVLTMI